MPRISRGEMWCEQVLAELGAPPWEREYVFRPDRDFKMDFAWPEHKIFLEFEGGGHQNWNRYHSDVEKYNEAALDGWRLVRVTFKMLEDEKAIKTMRALVKRLLEGH